jgi:hypothetical protein
MDVYRRLTRCTSLDMLNLLEHDVKDAFGDLPKQAVVLFAMTELRLLAGHWGIESIIKKDPDVILTVRDAAKAQAALTGAPGTLRVIDPRTVYLRMPPSFMESETLLMVLKNLMRQAYDREQKGEPIVQPGKAPEPAAPRAKPPVHRHKIDGDGKVQAPGRPTVRVGTSTAAPAAAKPQAAKRVISADHPELKKLQSLRDAGILTEQEFQAARERLLAKA